ncbi:hypothetical protein AVEN_123752-1 [Araneus ventricosus]|uniref:Uncharacterized protein n=1 Tax=Araneus ventricosus TaxID=182803 RepID=A0A4Y2BMD0_ARAVE|nr:hypothetical protein AVEN_123752-1 [Araneus ventricosus]
MVPGSKPDSIEGPPCMWVWYTLNHPYGAKYSPVGVVRKLRYGVPAQVSSSSSDRDSKLRGPSQNSPRAASKRDVNKTKLL